MVDKWMRLWNIFSCYFKPDRFNVVVKLYVLNGMSLTSIHVDAYASTDPVGSISAKEAEPIDVIKAVWFSMDTPRLLYANKEWLKFFCNF